MTSAKSPSSISHADYLAAAEKSDARLEFYDGTTVAMSGGTTDHAALTAAFIASLTSALRGKPCRVYSSDLRVRIEATRTSVYPDLTVVYGELRTSPSEANAAMNPALVVELLSPPTEGHDRGPKAAHYRRLKRLREYVLVS